MDCECQCCDNAGSSAVTTVLPCGGGDNEEAVHVWAWGQHGNLGTCHPILLQT